MRADYYSALLLGDACHWCWVREWGSFLDGVGFHGIDTITLSPRSLTTPMLVCTGTGDLGGCLLSLAPEFMLWMVTKACWKDEALVTLNLCVSRI